MNRTALAAGVVLAATTSGACAGELSVTPSLHAEGQFDSNPTLATTDEEDVGGGFVQTSAEVVAQGERGKLLLRPTAWLYRYNQDGRNDELDRFEGGSDLESTYDLSSRFDLGLDGHFFRQYTITTEAEDTGATTQKRWRNQLDAMPHAGFDISEVQRLELSGDYLRTRYEDGDETLPFDYEQKRGKLRHEYKLSQTSHFHVEGWYSDFDSDAPGLFDYQAETTALAIGDYMTFSNGTTLDVSAGAARSHLDFDYFGVARDRHTTDVIGSIELGRTFPTADAAISYERLIVPSSRGTIALADRYVARGKVQFSERVQGLLEVFYQERESRSIGHGDEPRNNYGALTAQLAYQVTSMWTFGGGYRYRGRENPDSSGPTADAGSECVFLFVNMVGTKFASPF